MAAQACVLLMVAAAPACATPSISFVPRASQHCVTWTDLDSYLQQEQHTTAKLLEATPGRPLCRYRSSGDSCMSSELLAVGFLDGDTDLALSERSCKLTVDFERENRAAIEVPVLDTTCKVWWRYASNDVLPPIPEMTFPFGQRNGTGDDENFLGLCRMLEDDAAAEIPPGPIAASAGSIPRLGTLQLSGDGVGNCLVPGEQPLVGGGYFFVQARESLEGSCVEDAAEQKELSGRLQSLLHTYITAQDRAAIAEVSGFPYTDLQSAVLNMGSCELNQVLSAVRFIPHPHNTLGLTVLRHILAERIYKARQLRSGVSDHPDYASFTKNGFLLKDLTQLSDDDVLELLRMASGEQSIGIPTAIRWASRNTSHTENDPQYEPHLDNSCGPIIKVWVYGKDVSLDSGPLHYSEGSHRWIQSDHIDTYADKNVKRARLRWLHQETILPALEAMKEPALRVRDGTDDAPGHGFKPLKPILPLPNASLTLVLVDSSGLHHRGEAVPGVVRKSLRLLGDNAGGLPRLNPFRPLVSG